MAKQKEVTILSHKVIYKLLEQLKVAALLLMSNEALTYSSFPIRPTWSPSYPGWRRRRWWERQWC